jgi:aspartate carbamoyltransferase catalytic subunit
MNEQTQGIKGDWEQFNELSLLEKGKTLSQTSHTLIAQQFNRSALEELFVLATTIRTMSKCRDGARYLKTVLSDKRAMLYFAQPSSRTYLSFQAACQLLGLDTMDVRDSKTSSEVKGESPEDTVRTFSSYVDLIIMRHPVGGFSEQVAWMLSQSNREVPVINAGSGADQHPTQALLDVYTLERSFEAIGGIDHKTILFVGDLKRGRTVRSLAWMTTLFKEVKLIFAAPEALQIRKDILEMLDAHDVDYTLSDSMHTHLPDADAIYMTRLQDEWDEGGNKTALSKEAFSLSSEHLAVMRSHAIIMHPLPRREEIATDLDNEPQAIYWRQMRNGMWMRAALILKTFGREDLILNWKEV